MAMIEHANKHMAGRSVNEEGRFWKILRIVGWSGAAIIMLLPLIGGLFTDEINWTLSDFILAAIILGGIGLSFELAMRRSTDNAYRTGMLLALAAGFFLIWSNAAVGFIGAGANAANILYAVMIVIPILGSIIAGFRPNGMSTTMIVTAIAQASITVFAFAIDLVREDDMALITAINGVFIAFWIASALLFRQAAERTGYFASGTQGPASKHEFPIHFLLSILLIVIGAILTAGMITVESEPGALPLLLVLLGMGWFFITFFRARSAGST